MSGSVSGVDHIDADRTGDATSLPGVVNRTSLAERLALSPGPNGPVGRPVEGFDQRVFGGHLMAQIVLAAGIQAPDGRVVESLHLYFLRPGRPDGPITYPTVAVRHGRSRSVMEVRAVQGGRELVRALVSLGPGDVPVTPTTPVPAPAPEDLPGLVERRRAELPSDGVRLPPLGDWRTASRPLDVRPVDRPGPHGERMLWLRSEPVPGAEDHLHRAILAFASDRSLVPVIAHTRGEDPDLHRPAASVDHALWFHTTPRAGDWYLYEQDCPVAGERGGVARGVLRDRTGQVVATVAQHAVLLD
jgi:acyl-CoA thioesterase-2